MKKVDLDFICSMDATVEMKKRGPKKVLWEMLAKDKLPTQEHVVILRSTDGSMRHRFRVVTGIMSIEEEEENEDG